MKRSKKPFSPSLIPTHTEPYSGTYSLFGLQVICYIKLKSSQTTIYLTLSCSVNICREMKAWHQSKIIYFYLVRTLGWGSRKSCPRVAEGSKWVTQRNCLLPQSQVDLNVLQTRLDWQILQLLGRAESFPPPYCHPNTSFKKKKNSIWPSYRYSSRQENLGIPKQIQTGGDYAPKVYLRGSFKWQAHLNIRIALEF